MAQFYLRTASQLKNVPAGDITEQEVQGALNGLDTRKAAAIIIQSLGVQNADVTINLSTGLYVKFTPNIGLNLSIPNGASATIAQLLIVEIIQGAIARTVTLKAADANIFSSGGLLASGKALFNDGANTTTKYEFLWNGGVWETKDARFDIKAG